MARTIVGIVLLFKDLQFATSTSPVELLSHPSAYLLQKKTHTDSIEADNEASASNSQTLSYVQNLAEKVALHNVTMTSEEKDALATIKQLISRLDADYEKQNKEDQNELDRMYAVVGGCGTAANAGQSQADQLEQTAHKECGEHDTCRVNETGIANNCFQLCGLYDAHRKSVPPPDCLTSMTGAFVASDTEKMKMEPCLEGLHAWFWPLWKVYVPCRDCLKKRKDKKEVCASHQVDCELATCTYANKQDDVCDTLTSCRTTKIPLYTATKGNVTVSVAARCADSKAGAKILCFLKVLEEDDNKKKPDEYKDCVDFKPSCRFNITPPEPPLPPAPPCTKVSERPCDDTWLAHEYKEKEWYKTAPTAPCHHCIEPAGVPRLAADPIPECNNIVTTSDDCKAAAEAMGRKFITGDYRFAGCFGYHGGHFKDKLYFGFGKGTVAMRESKTDARRVCEGAPAS